jgi:hypothetical protein
MKLGGILSGSESIVITSSGAGLDEDTSGVCELVWAAGGGEVPGVPAGRCCELWQKGYDDILKSSKASVGASLVP